MVTKPSSYPLVFPQLRIGEFTVDVSDQDRLRAESFLHFMKEPADVIDRIDETCEIDGLEIKRRVRLVLGGKLVTAGKRRAPTTALVDIMHPRKGAMPDVSIEMDPAAGRRLSHAQHLVVTQFLIHYRFMSVWNSAIVPDGESERFDERMSAAYLDLLKLPDAAVAAHPRSSNEGRHEPRSEAEQILDRHFKSGILEALIEVPGLKVDAEKAYGLARLCEELAERYLLLVEVAVSNTLPVVEFTYRHDATESVDLSGRWAPLRRAWRARYASAPPAFRVHTPWAKRTDHYTFQLEPPPSYFFGAQVILTDQPGDSNTTFNTRTARRPVAASRLLKFTKWSINTGQGARSTVFLSGGPQEAGRIYLGFLNLEIPGRSITRTANMAWFVAAAVATFSLLASAFHGPILEAMSLIVALVSIGAFASPAPAGRGPIGTPLMSRILPVVLAFLAGWSSIWVLSRALTADAMPSELPNELVEFASSAWEGWQEYGAIPAVVAVTAIAIYCSVRRTRLAGMYRRVFGADRKFMHNMYSSEATVD
jgi:hypothetical protein